ncbi:hypothetical protein M3616_11155 [Bacillus velezensis]|nr:hypothetical protein [Bacillus velezensis]CUB46482.1 hypothetical protein BN2127_JRS8_03957 [Bacillus amyloliquefaciens]MCA1231420.1 hypothetical protein [Bacillus velezensis]MCA1309520.1 hypothetical protein [Bacillus velezensis]MCA1329187.1 hypothetical protein [Bacillus velezensis]MCM3276673.1 hypothetical protein [Bacillus velezensis]
MTKTKITIKTSDKVEVTRAQAWAIDEGMKFYLKMADAEPERVNALTKGDKKEFARLQFVGKHFVIKIGDVEPWTGLFDPLNSMSAYDLNKAILKGYLVKEGAEQ